MKEFFPSLRSDLLTYRVKSAGSWNARFGRTCTLDTLRPEPCARLTGIISYTLVPSSLRFRSKVRLSECLNRT